MLGTGQLGRLQFQRVNKCMNRVTLEERIKIVEPWKKLQLAPQDQLEDNPDFWVIERLWEFSEESPELCLEIVLAIFDSTDNAKVLGNLAAGPLEDLLVSHGEKVIDKIESFAFEDKRFRQLLGGVWKNDIPDDIWRRIETARNLT